MYLFVVIRLDVSFQENNMSTRKCRCFAQEALLSGVCYLHLRTPEKAEGRSRAAATLCVIKEMQDSFDLARIRRRGRLIYKCVCRTLSRQPAL